MSARRRRRVKGLVPLFAERVKALGRWLLRHPQPFLLAVGLAVALWAVATYAQQTEAFRISAVQWPPDASWSPTGKPVVPSNAPLGGATSRPPTRAGTTDGAHGQGRGPMAGFELREPLIGRNLWAVDLRAVAEGLQRQQPWLKEVRVVRQLPDTVQIDAVPRQPVAQIRLDQWYPVDREGFILPWGSREPVSGLVQLVGFQPSAGALRVGADNPHDRLQLGLRVLEVLQRAPTSIARRVTELDVADPQQIRFLLDGGIEVRCGEETELAAHLERLQAVVKLIRRQSLAVRYIDLRFQEPVIGSTEERKN